MNPPLIIAHNVTAVAGERRIDLTLGKPVDADLAALLGRGKLASLQSCGWALPLEEFRRQFADEEASPAPAADEPPADGPPADWLATPTTQLAVPKPLLDALIAAGLTTVGPVLADGRDHGSLTRHKGIGAAGEQHIQQAIAQLHPSPPPAD
ncbi:MAG TPA: hypothetical protein PJ982_05760 [Lacipirellulaceae bacterium]|nr:hypothetical protein [Lacipirellulaceae bacterium]